MSDQNEIDDDFIELNTSVTTSVPKKQKKEVLKPKKNLESNKKVLF